MNQYTDKCLKDVVWTLGKILNENDNQLLKWGIQIHSSFEWLTYTAEELGELAKAITEFEYRGGSREAVIKEAIQTATLALKIAEMFDETQ